MATKSKPSIVIDESAQNLFTSILHENNGFSYESLPDSLKSLITESDFKKLISDLDSTEPLRSRFTKLFVLVDYIKSFVDGSLGSSDAKSIESSVLHELSEAMDDPDTAVVVLIDSHYNDEVYLSSREGLHLPVPHANTKDERMIYGKVGSLLGIYYDKSEDIYKSNDSDGIYFMYKSTFGELLISSQVDSEITDAIDSILKVDLENVGGNLYPSWNTLYNTAQNLSLISFIPDRIRIVGVATNVCVLSNAIILQNQYPQAEIDIPVNAVASYDDDLHNMALRIMEGLGMNLIN